MTTRSASTIMRIADPAADVTVTEAWSDAEGRAAFERIIADDRTIPSGRSRRRTYRRLAIGAAVAAAGGTAAAVVGLPGAQHNGAPSAWSVTKQHNILTVQVTEYRDPGGLERRLNAAGLRTDVVTLPVRCMDETSGPGSLVNYWLETRAFRAAQHWWALVGLPADGHRDDGDRDPSAGRGRGHIEIWGEGIAGGEENHPSSLTVRFDATQLPAGDTVTLAFPQGETAGRLDMYVIVTPTGHAPTCPAQQHPPKNQP